jgi:hypothetical protein
MKCRCSWIDSAGKETSDSNEAIAMAVCYDPVVFGEKGSQPFPICQEHAQEKKRYWKLLPLPGIAVEKSHELVKKDALYFPKIITDVVIRAVYAAFPRLATNVLYDLKWDSLNGCYCFGCWGIFIGIEEDGHIHS